jgi:hypothetical protein
MTIRLLLSPRQTLEDLEPDWPERIPVQPGDIVVQREDDRFAVFRYEADTAEPRVLVFASLPAALAAAQESELALDHGTGRRLMTADDAAGMAWWNVQSEAARSFWLDRAGAGASAADAWALFKQYRGRKTERRARADDFGEQPKTEKGGRP